MVRFGIMGAGKIAHKFCIAANGIGAILEAVASRDSEKARKFQLEHRVHKMYDSYEKMLSDNDIDCVYIATPHGLHFEHLIACLKANKNVLCEKAFTLNRSQAKCVFALAEKKHRFVMEELQRTIQNGEIGQITRLDAAFAFQSDAAENDRLFDPALGGGALLDVGIYPITFANLILGIPERFESVVKFASTGVDATESIVYHYPQSVAHLQASIRTDLGREATIYGTKGTIHVPAFWAAEKAEILDLTGNLVRLIFEPHWVNGMEYEIQETTRCIEAGLLQSPQMSWETTLEILRQTDALRKSWHFFYPQEKS
jgi:dihydrodiol dehydrogenase / D-xylose 1-dehydrogenase (NADP)